MFIIMSTGKTQEEDLEKNNCTVNFNVEREKNCNSISFQSRSALLLLFLLWGSKNKKAAWYF